MRSLCPDFTVVPSEVDETLAPGPAAAAVKRLALDKAQAVAARVAAGVVLGADTVVVIDGEALGKPATADDARQMLRRLRGREHEVVTGVAVVEAPGGRCETTAVVSRVRMADYGEADIEAYVASGEPFDKAGAYAIQGRAARFIVELRGSYSGVMGLPLYETAQLLDRAGSPRERR